MKLFFCPSVFLPLIASVFCLEFKLVIQFKQKIVLENIIDNTIQKSKYNKKTLANTIDWPSNTFGNKIGIVLLSQINFKLF